MTTADRVLEVLELLAPHRQQLLLDTAVALLEMQVEVDTRPPYTECTELTEPDDQ